MVYAARSHIYKYENVLSILTQVKTIVLLYLALSFLWTEVQFISSKAVFEIDKLKTECKVDSRLQLHKI